MTLDERKQLLESRLNEAMAQKNRLEMGLAETNKVIERCIGALQLIAEVEHESPDVRRYQDGSDQAVGEQAGSLNSRGSVDQ